MAKGKKKDGVYYRAVKFEIQPTDAQVAVLWRISESLRGVWNGAVSARQQMYEMHLKPIYDRIAEEKRRAAEAGYETLWQQQMRKVSAKKLEAMDIPASFVSAREQLLTELAEAYKEHGISLFDQINALTPRRRSDPQFAAVPRNWQEEMLDTVNAGFRSFMKLRGNGDPDARPPRLRENPGFFCEIPGRRGFTVSNNLVTLRCGVLDETPWTFPIPGYQQQQMGGWNSINKFTLRRDPKDQTEAGRWWVSIAGSVKQPAMKPLHNSGVVFLAPGASCIGISGPRGDCVIRLWRPDRFWKPKIEAVETRMKTAMKGSRYYKRLQRARRTMFRKMSDQQRLNHRTIVCRLMGLGIHFVTTDLIIRSKEGKLADSSKPGRRGSLGPNWAAQNTGGIAELVALLEERVKEFGGSVQKFQPPSLPPSGKGDAHKIAMAQRLRRDWLATP